MKGWRVVDTLCLLFFFLICFWLGVLGFFSLLCGVFFFFGNPLCQMLVPLKKNNLIQSYPLLKSLTKVGYSRLMAAFDVKFA